MSSYSDVLKDGIELLKKAGVAEAEIDARLLLEYVCHIDRNFLILYGSRPVSQKEEELYFEAVKKRESRIPLQHITGRQEFMGLTFTVNENVLVPRQDTECLVEEAMTCIDDGMTVLDMCTGSGCIIISLSKYKNNLKAYGVDISEAALEVAKENAYANNTNVEFLKADLFVGIETLRGTFDVIVSNPPYIKTEVIKDLMPEVKEYDPYIALDGHEDGLYFYRKMIKEIPEYLKKEGYVLFEIGYDQADAVSKLLLEGGYERIEVIKDLAGMDRVVKALFINKER